MKSISLILIPFLGMLLPKIVWSQPSCNMLGEWKYVAFEYEGETQPLPNPDLDLRFIFSIDTVLLKWHYEREDEFCESLSEYDLRENNWMYQKVFWLNPNNHSSCAKDPDMKLGKESLTHYSCPENKFFLDLELGGKPFVLVLEKITNTKEKNL